MLEGRRGGEMFNLGSAVVMMMVCAEARTAKYIELYTDRNSSSAPRHLGNDHKPS